ncbi:MAG: hypothetical protein ACFNLR_09380, partial [Prevotella denticola]
QTPHRWGKNYPAVPQGIRRDAIEAIRNDTTYRTSTFSTPIPARKSTPATKPVNKIKKAQPLKRKRNQDIPSHQV